MSTVRDACPLTADEVVEVAGRIVDDRAPTPSPCAGSPTSSASPSPSIYWHVGNRDELVDALVDRLLADVGTLRARGTTPVSASRRWPGRCARSCSTVRSSSRLAHEQAKTAADVPARAGRHRRSSSTRLGLARRRGPARRCARCRCTSSRRCCWCARSTATGPSSRSTRSRCSSSRSRRCSTPARSPGGRSMTPGLAPAGRGPRIAIIGAGPGGICMAKRLLDEGFDDFVILERNGGVGGTWYQNRYPGCECDVPSALYSFSFEIKADWSKPVRHPARDPAPTWSTSPRSTASSPTAGSATRSGARRGTTSAALWTLELEHRRRPSRPTSWSARSACSTTSPGPTSTGSTTFAGTIFHSARWDWDHDLTGEPVAVIGSAASAVQFVPEIVEDRRAGAPLPAHRNWVLPKPDDPYTDGAARARSAPIPTPCSRSGREIEANMNQGMTFADPQQNARARGGRAARDRGGGGPRGAGASSARPPVRLQAAAVLQRLLPRRSTDRTSSSSPSRSSGSPRTPWSPPTVSRGGSTRSILATGFAATKYLSAIDVVGRDGGTSTTRGTTARRPTSASPPPGSPTCSCCYGPNTNNGSILTMIESQVEHILRHLRRLAATTSRGST